ncbi:MULTISPECIES: L,D-transpeptidase family protein [unclassified Paracoccus (in: a-proteobacteria)]|uniref:L,D-transpeptidase family protein n=1 Tax=unclassified Paracoccus (in: a-proteobacteria) TaxID=2688777 RepID=UPI0012B1C2F6|nr:MULTISPECIES: L,D-transpeptidase family protein [unclassified Paracoccus (in: a-proteobacteria)]UXU76274.1 L,D-transpeptidase family protein [Paracoccus sp. SMMA_5]UXU82161.1 L,D-transpeptidase family protein [Paracoccus sp. SMMA_5_TC]
MGLWARGRVLPCSVGRGGLRADKREGDGATPLGRHRIIGLLYRPDRVARPAPWARPILPGDLWCDDSDHAAYNRLARAPLAASHEALRRPDPLYDIVLVTDWNWPDARPGAGSAIFLHQWRRPGFPTAGCIAMARADLFWLAGVIRPNEPLLVPALPRWPARRPAARHGKD